MKILQQHPTTIFETCYQTHREAIFRHCLFRVYGNREVALDLTQEVFTKTWMYLSEGKTIKNTKAFLYTTAERTIIDHIRKKKTLSLDELEEQGNVFISNTLNQKNLGEQVILYKYLNTLDETDRELITLRYLSGLKPKEIAQIKELPVNVISVRIHRACSKLRSLMA